MKTDNKAREIFKVESGIEMPTIKRNSRWKEQFSLLVNVGDSFAFPSDIMSSVCQAASRLKLKFACRPSPVPEEKGQHRIWKIA